MSYTNGQQALQDVIAHAGAVPRDSADRRLLREVQDGTGQWRTLTSAELSTRRLIPRDPLTLPKWTKPQDSDNDGMPDHWEAEHGLNPNDSTDLKTPMNGGYDAIEVFVNELSDTLVQTGVWPSTWIARDLSLPRLDRVLQTFPNPAPCAAHILFSLPRPQRAEISVYNTQGKLIRRLFSGPRLAGDQEVIWNGLGDGGWPAPSGTYLVKLSAQGRQMVKSMVLIR